MRLDKLLGNMGLGTRKDIKDRVKKGEVTVNGEVVAKSSIHVDPDKDKIEVQGQEIHYRENLYLMVNKPKDYVCATDDSYHRTVLELLEPQHLLPGIHPVGRLDKDTTGFLILTTDGKFTHHLTSPKKEVDKTYMALLDGRIDQNTIKKFQEGIYIEQGDYTTKPAHLEEILLEDQYLAQVTIREGKFHQVKYMFKSQGLEVQELMRTSIGGVELDPILEEGEYRELTQEEIDILWG